MSRITITKIVTCLSQGLNMAWEIAEGNSWVESCVWLYQETLTPSGCVVIHNEPKVTYFQCFEQSD